MTTRRARATRRPASAPEPRGRGQPPVDGERLEVRLTAAQRALIDRVFGAAGVEGPAAGSGLRGRSTVLRCLVDALASPDVMAAAAHNLRALQD